MKIKEYIQLLEELPEHLKETELSLGKVTAYPKTLVRGRNTQDHFSVYFVDSSVVSLVSDRLRTYPYKNPIV